MKLSKHTDNRLFPPFSNFIQGIQVVIIYLEEVVPVVCCADKDLASPKSAILQLHSVSNRMLDGF